MSFLGDIVGSIGTGKAPPPRPQPARLQSSVGRPTQATGSRPGTPNSAGPQTSGLKRKAEGNDSSSRPQDTKTYSGSIQSPRNPQPRLIASQTQASKGVNTIPQAGKSTSSTPSTVTAPTASKAPPSKGSFADLMARATAQKSQQSFGGGIKHTKTAQKEKLSRREQERRKKDAVDRTEKSGSGQIRKPEPSRGTSPTKSGVQDGRISKPASARPTYKGTLGMSTKNDRPRQEKKSRFDDYLGTDEEDNSDIEDDGVDGYESSDMEGGFDDVEAEEQAASRAARVDDARELALENQLKREKEDRRQRLQALANKRK